MSAKLISLLAQTRIFGSLDAENLAMCTDAFEEQHFTRGQPLFRRGDPGTHLYLVESGSIRLAIPAASGTRGLTFQIATAGDMFGEIAALDGELRTADATAVTDATVHCLERVVFQAIWERRPEFALRVVAFLCGRLRQMTTQFESIALQPLDVRLARFILSALDPHQAPIGKRIPLELGFSQGELAHLLCASRPKVNAAMASLERAGAMRRTLDRLFCDPQKLALIARSLENEA